MPLVKYLIVIHSRLSSNMELADGAFTLVELENVGSFQDPPASFTLPIFTSTLRLIMKCSIINLTIVRLTVFASIFVVPLLLFFPFLLWKIFLEINVSDCILFL